MGTKTDLDTTFDKYFSNTFKKLNLEQFSEYSSGMGAVRYFKNEYLKIQLVNDRGIIDLMITNNESEDFRDAELIFNWLTIEKTDVKSITKADRKKILTTRSGFLEQNNSLEIFYSEIIKKFNRKNFKQTLKTLNQLGSERMKYYELK
jgi:succinate dehydrogenase flavin-adding protein (antitoxin of CptAB toxin-antitoxin module)